MDEKNPTTAGVTVKASPVEVAKPYFKEDTNKPKRYRNPLTEPLNASTILTGNGVFCREDEKKVVASKIDLDEHSFAAVGNSLFTERTNSLIAMCHLAFAEHRPMALTPDLLWHYIVKGISIHIHKYSEELRKKFVSHEGKKELTVTRDKLDLDAEDWSGAFKEFRSQIEATLTEDGKAMITENKFSTTSEVIDDVSCIALMDTISKYYSYRMVCICGIPSVTLLGKKEDWMELKNRSERTLQLLSSDDLKGEVSLSWWKSPLLAVLDKLIQCYDDPESAENKDWMARIYKSEREGYGGHAFICGWVNVFFPYLGNSVEAKEYRVNEWANNDLIQMRSDLKMHFDMKKNDNCENKDQLGFGHGHFDNARKFGNSGSAFPKAISSVDFTWIKPGQQHKMKIHGGPCCVSEQMVEAGFPCPPGTLHAHFGWLIKHNPDVRQG